MDTPDSPIPSLDAFTQLFADAGKAYAKSFHEVAAAFAGPTAPPTDFEPTEDERTWGELKEALDEQERILRELVDTIQERDRLIENLNNDIIGLGGTVAEYRIEVRDLKDENGNLKNRIADRSRINVELKNTVADLKTTIDLQATEVQRLLTDGHRVRGVLLETLGQKKTDSPGLSSVTLAVQIQDDLKGFQDLTRSLRQKVEELRGRIRAARDTLHP